MANIFWIAQKKVPTVFGCSKSEQSGPDVFFPHCMRCLSKRENFIKPLFKKHFDISRCHNVSNLNENTLKLGILQQILS